MKRQYKVGAKVEGMLYRYWELKKLAETNSKKEIYHELWDLQDKITQILFFTGNRT